MKRCKYELNKSIVYIGAVTITAAIGGLAVWLYRRRSKKKIRTKKYQTSEDEAKGCFISNLDKYITYSPADDKEVSGVSFEYKGDKPYEIRLFAEQTGVRVISIDKENGKKELPVDFGNVGIDDEEDEPCYIYNDNEYLIGQYDFDRDGIDELIVAVRTRNKITNGISINIFRPADETQWILTSEMAVLGDCDASIEGNKITIPRHLHGLNFTWIYCEDEDNFNLIEDGFGNQPSSEEDNLLDENILEENLLDEIESNDEKLDELSEVLTNTITEEIAENLNSENISKPIENEEEETESSDETNETANEENSNNKFPPASGKGRKNRNR